MAEDEEEKTGSNEEETVEKAVSNEDENAEKPRRKGDDNVVFIGSKPFMNYVTGVVMQFTTKGSNEVIIKARGKFISRAVDVEQVAKNKFLVEHGVYTKDIKTASEEFQNKEGRMVNVSTIEITLAKKGH